MAGNDPRPAGPLQPGGWSGHEPQSFGAGPFPPPISPPSTGGPPAPIGWAGSGAPDDRRAVAGPVKGARPRPARQWWVLPGSRVEYHQLLRGPKRRWWRPILCLLLAALIFVAGSVVVLLPTALIGALADVDDLGQWMQVDALASGAAPTPGGLLYLFLLLAALIPAAMLSTWAVHRVRPGFLSSVAGRLRWRWLLASAAVVAPAFAIYMAVLVLLSDAPGPRPADWVALLVISTLLSPFQAAGEEYLFRGVLLHNVGSYFRNARLGLVVATAVSAAAFALAHGSLDPWVLISLVLISVAACYLTWRTGGLETAIVIHAANNVGTGIVGLTFGGFSEAFVDAETSGSPYNAVLMAMVLGVVVAGVVLVARRARPARFYEPPAELVGHPTATGTWSGGGPGPAWDQQPAWSEQPAWGQQPDWGQQPGPPAGGRPS